ncbi:MAG TPA: aminotransferase class V-fold PLP-dependent enzyme [Gemmataceae bacterium]|nr:aminotransferase class V-fold PLP-dependent enzyme [Gemmataceae bacterium]
MPSAFWSSARARMMLDPNVTNLNTGSFGPSPRPVFDRVTELRRRLAEEPMDFFLRGLPPLLWQARAALAQFLGGDPRRLVFTVNVTAAVNLVASSLRLASPGEILLTDHEYGAMHWTWERAAQRQGLTLRTFPLPILATSPREIVDAACAAMTERTRLFFFSHVLSPTGLVLPARELCAEARKRGVLTVVDGAHAPAFVPLNLNEINADFYGSNCHKWLLAPTGSGFLYLGPGAWERIAPLQVSWGWRPERGKLDEPDEFGSTPRLRFLEFEGTRDVCPWLAVPTAIKFQQEIGLERIRERIGELTRHVRRGLTGLCGLTPATPEHPALHGAMTAFRLPAGHDPAALRQDVWERWRIEIPVIERPEGLLIRVSTHFYNTEEEVERLAEALPHLLHHA